MIEFRNVTRHFGEFVAVRDLSFSVDRGTGITALLGPNGAGKSTTLRLLTGYLKPTGGEILINGLSLNSPEMQVEIKKRIGYLPESAPLYPEMLVSEYLEFSGNARGISPAELPGRIEEMVDRLELGSHFYSPAGILSKGFRQRLALAGSLIHHPEIVILDEPTSGLDPNQIVHIRNIIRDLGKTSTLILSTHIMQEVEDLCDRVIVVSRGSIVADRSMQEMRGDRGGVEILVKVEPALLQTGIHEFDSGMELVHQEQSKDGYYRYSLRLGSRPVEEVFRFIADRGWDVRSFTPSVRSLQDIFHELTG